MHGVPVDLVDHALCDSRVVGPESLGELDGVVRGHVEHCVTRAHDGRDGVHGLAIAVRRHVVAHRVVVLEQEAERIDARVAGLAGRRVLRHHLEVGPVRFIVEYELTPDALDRLSQFSAPAFVEPIVGKGGIVEVMDVQEVEEIPVLEAAEDIPELEIVEDSAPIPVDDFNFDAPKTKDSDQSDADQWYIPPANEIQDVLAELENARREV